MVAQYLAVELGGSVVTVEGLMEASEVVGGGDRDGAVVGLIVLGVPL